MVRFLIKFFLYLCNYIANQRQKYRVYMGKVVSLGYTKAEQGAIQILYMALINLVVSLLQIEKNSSQIKQSIMI